MNAKKHKKQEEEKEEKSCPDEKSQLQVNKNETE